MRNIEESYYCIIIHQSFKPIILSSADVPMAPHDRNPVLEGEWMKMKRGKNVRGKDFDGLANKV